MGNRRREREERIVGKSGRGEEREAFNFLQQSKE